MSKLPTKAAADALLPQISKIETTISSLGYYVGMQKYGPDGFDFSYQEGGGVPQREVASLLNQLWDEMNDLCNSIARALDSDGPTQETRVAGARQIPPQTTGGF